MTQPTPPDGATPTTHASRTYARALKAARLPATPDAIAAGMLWFGAAFKAQQGGGLGRTLQWSESAGLTGHHLFKMVQGGNQRRPARPYPTERITDVAHPPRLPAGEWRRLPSTGWGEDRHEWLVGFDVNAQYLAATSSVMLGSGRPKHKSENVKIGKLPGYYRLTLLDVSASYAAGLIPCMPGLIPDHRLSDGSVWVVQPIAALLQSEDAIAEVHEVIEWQKAARWLARWNATVRDTRALLRAGPAAGHPESQLALAGLKAMYASFLGGWLASDVHNRTELYRPDWRHMIVATARANQLRHLVRVWDASGRAPIMQYRDAVYYTADSPDYTPDGLEISDQIGKFKRGRVVRTAAIRDEFLKGTSASLLNRAIIAAIREETERGNASGGN